MDAPDLADNIVLLGHTDQGGRGDGVQVMVGDGHAYVGHMFSDGVTVLDVRDPRDPRPPIAGTWWLPGMHLGGGERPAWPSEHRYRLHHAIVADGLAHGSWRDGGLTVHDVSDPAAPRLLVHRNWSPPFGDGTHTALPLPSPDLLIVADEGIMDVTDHNAGLYVLQYEPGAS